MTNSDDTVQRAADTLRALALDEDLKARTLANPALANLSAKVARRYIAGTDVDAALALLEANTSRGHLGSIELVGESVRNETVAAQQTQEFIDLARRVGQASTPATISFDLSHVGAVVSPNVGLRNSVAIARAAREAETSIMISAEGSDRTNLVLSITEQIADEFPETGITLQTRLHRTPRDLDRLIQCPGPIRLVKGAFLEPADVAFARDSEPMTEAYIQAAKRLVGAGHRVNLATHDPHLIARLRKELGSDVLAEHVEFEMLQGLGTELLDSLREEGFTTREYIVYGPEWWLYVLNRIAEHPERIIQALADLNTAAKT